MTKASPGVIGHLPGLVVGCVNQAGHDLTSSLDINLAGHKMLLASPAMIDHIAMSSASLGILGLIIG